MTGGMKWAFNFEYTWLDVCVGMERVHHRPYEGVVLGGTARIQISSHFESSFAASREYL